MHLCYCWQLGLPGDSILWQLGNGSSLSQSYLEVCLLVVPVPLAVPLHITPLNL